VPHPFGMGAWLTNCESKYAPLPYVTIPNFVPYLGLYGVPNNFGDAEALPHRMGDVTDTLETCCFPPVFHAKFGHSTSNHMNIIMEICQKKFDPCVPPFKVTQSHWNQHGSISCLGLSISDPLDHGLSHTVSKINAISVQNHKFSHPIYLISR